MVVAAATAVEAKAARRELPGVRVIETGISLRKLREDLGGVVVSCGLAGGLHAGLRSGTVVIPNIVLRPDGTTMHCDAELVSLLQAAAHELGFTAIGEPLLTSASLVRGAEREIWSRRGYAAVDMETGLIDAARVAAVRVVLDTPERELSADWIDPVRAMLKPRNWPEMMWLARDGPAFARIAARVVGAALQV